MRSFSAVGPLRPFNRLVGIGNHPGGVDGVCGVSKRTSSHNTPQEALTLVEQLGKC